MTASRLAPRSPQAIWRETFVEEFAVKPAFVCWIREVTERGLLSAGDEADARLRDVRDIYVFFVEEFEEFLRKRRTDPGHSSE